MASPNVNGHPRKQQVQDQTTAAMTTLGSGYYEGFIKGKVSAHIMSRGIPRAVMMRVFMICSLTST